MKVYVGTKIIKAVPMTRGEYNEYRGWVLPENEDAADEGMLVEYLDGGEANHPEHAGYISWSPIDVFNKAYLFVTESSHRRRHILNAQAELAQLNVKIKNGEEYYRVTSDAGNEDELLGLQLCAMREYRRILQQRLQWYP